MCEFISQRKCFFYLVSVLFLKLGLTVFAIIYAKIGLGPDEAQYWTWSQQLAFGYYSKPPGIAWEIWSGTQLFGNTELGVRFGALILGTMLAFGVYWLACAAKLSSQASFWAAMVFAWSPLGVMSTLLAITDTGMVFFWLLGSILVADGLNKNRPCSYYLLGACIAVGALFKWVMYEFWIVIIVLACLLPLWRSKHIVGGMMVSLFGLIPSLVWNVYNDWATFRHVGATVWTTKEVDIGTTGLLKGNFFEFFGAQIVLLSPIVFALFLFGVWELLRRRERVSTSLLFCGAVSILPLCIYCSIATFKKMQGNWVDYIYPSAAVLVSWYAYDYKPKYRLWMFAGVAVAFVLSVFALAMPTIVAERYLPLSYKANPFKHNVGWENIASVLTDLGFNSSENFLFADKYQSTSILSFYGPEQKRAYFLNLQGIRKNQFSYWPGMPDQQIGKTGYFVVFENALQSDPKWKDLEENYKKLLKPYFHEIDYLGIHPLFTAGKVAVKSAMVFKTSGYNGLTPSDVEIY